MNIELPQSNPQEMGSTRRAFQIVAGATLILVAIASVAIRSLTQNTLYSPTDLPRDTNAISKLLETTLPKPEIDWSALDTLSITNEPDGSKVTLVYSNDLDRPPAEFAGYQLHQLHATNRLQVDDGVIYLRSISVGYGAFDQEELTNYDKRIEPRIFGPDLRLLSKEAVEELFPNEWQRTIRYEGEFPSVKFVVATKGLGPLINLGAQFIDATTGESLSTSYSYGANDQTLNVDVDLNTWIPRPLYFAINIGHGPTAIETHKTDSSFVIDSKSGALKWLGLFDGRSAGSSTSSREGFTEYGIRLKKESSDGNPQSTALFMGYPTANPFPANFTFLDKNGEKLNTGGGSSSRMFKRITVRAPAADVDAVQVEVFQNIRKVVFYIPYLPGLPEENEGLDNFFKAHIPYMRIRNRWELRDAIEDLTQLRLPFSPNPGTNALTYPLIFKATTPKELLEVYERTLTPTQALTVDLESREFVTALPFWQRIRERIRSLLSTNP